MSFPNFVNNTKPVGAWLARDGGRTGARDLEGRRALPSLPLTQPLLQIQRAMNLQLPRPAEQNQRQLSSGQRIGTGIVALEHFQFEPVAMVAIQRTNELTLRALD